MSHHTVSEGIVISPIKNGTVIDHITHGEGFTVIRILGIRNSIMNVTVASNVMSSRGGRKDIVKIENRELLKSEVDKVALVAPDATISIIRDFKVTDKKNVDVPKDVVGVIKCPNPNCITNTNEPVPSHFVEHPRGFRCVYCDAVISKDMVGQYI
ncbi:MAG: aspartate carbamoyltransferase regulatory subunit [Methanocorpusculum sp.]|nr:aspartate carbamoyltransferase regulatory subunit [Methanocorpusculum sp.]